MSEPIGVGNLVVVVRNAKCGCPVNNGRIAKVTSIRKVDFTLCVMCGDRRKFNGPYAISDGRYIAGVWRLKRIPPLSELEGQPTQEDIKEPA